MFEFDGLDRYAVLTGVQAGTAWNSDTQQSKMLYFIFATPLWSQIWSWIFFRKFLHHGVSLVVVPPGWPTARRRGRPSCPFERDGVVFCLAGNRRD